MFIKPTSSTFSFVTRVISVVVAAVFISGLPTAVYGASNIDFSGTAPYRIYPNTAPAVGSAPPLDITFSATDEISSYWRLRRLGPFYPVINYHGNCPTLFRLRGLWAPNWKARPILTFEQALPRIKLLGEAIGLGDPDLMGPTEEKINFVTDWISDNYPSRQQIELLAAFYQARHDGPFHYGIKIYENRASDRRFYGAVNCPWCWLDPDYPTGIYLMPESYFPDSVQIIH